MGEKRKDRTDEVEVSALRTRVAELEATAADLKLAREKAHRNEASYRGLFTNMASGFAHHRTIVDDAGKPVDYVFLEINRAFEQLTGLKREDVIGKRVTELLPGIENDPFDWIGKYGDIALNGGTLEFAQFSPPLERWYSVVAYSPEPGHFAAVFHDVTGLELAKQSLAEQKERLAVTLRSIGDGVITTDRDGHIELVNRVTEHLTGWLQEEVVGKPLPEVFKIINEKTRKPCPNPVELVLSTGSIQGLSNHTVLIARDGTERIIADSGAPIRDAESNIVGVVLVFRDVTEATTLQDELLKARKLESIGLLAGGIAHDFNNILTVIQGNVSLAAALARSHPKQGELLGRAEEACLRARDLTQQLLTFAKGGAPVRETASLAEIINKSAEFSSRGSNISYAVELGQELWAVEVDTGQMSQVVQNLVINAIQAMPEGGELTVSMDNVTVIPEDGLPVAPGNYVRTSFSDTGPGIPEHLLPNVFDPYFTTKETGTGLGLATAYSIIKRHDGCIKAASGPDGGAVFTFYLPASADRVVTRPGDHRRLSRGNARILLMDDDESVALAVRNMLALIGCTGDFAPDGDGALAAYRQAMEDGRPYDAVILDLTVPGAMGGIETMGRLRELDPDVKAIVSSGYSTSDIMANYRGHGFHGVIAKPYGVIELSDVLKRVLPDKFES